MLIVMTILTAQYNILINIIIYKWRYYRVTQYIDEIVKITTRVSWSCNIGKTYQSVSEMMLM